MNHFLKLFITLLATITVAVCSTELSIANNTIHYTTSNGAVVTINNPDAFGAPILSNTYKNGVGKITFSIDVTKIGEHAFKECSNLVSITMPSSVTEIRLAAFWGCSNLISITIPTNVRELGESVFFNCTSLTSIYCKGTTPPSLGYYYYNTFGNNNATRKIYVPAISVDAYKASWDKYADYIVAEQ